MQKDFLVIIPARAGSKGLKKKNIIKFCNKPLISWTIKAAIKCIYFKEIIVSTDSEKIKIISEKFGAKVPFLRPKSISNDSSSMHEVIMHSLNFYKKKNIYFKYIVLLEPTSPIREPNDLKKAVDIFLKNKKKINSLVSLGEIFEHPYLIKIKKKLLIKNFIDTKKKYFRRQDLPNYYFPYGLIYLSKIAYYLKYKSFITNATGHYMIKQYQNIEIDSIYDLYKAESIFKKRKLNLKL